MYTNTCDIPNVLTNNKGFTENHNNYYMVTKPQFYGYYRYGFCKSNSRLLSSNEFQVGLGAFAGGHGCERRDFNKFIVTRRTRYVWYGRPSFYLLSIYPKESKKDVT